MPQSPQWPLVNTGTPVSTQMACLTTIRTPTVNERSTGVTRRAALLQRLTSPPKVLTPPLHHITYPWYILRHVQSGLGPLCTMLKYWCRLCCWSGLPCAWAFSVCLAPYSSVSVQHEFDQGADACHTDVGSYPCFSCYLHSRSYPCDMCTNNVIRSAG